VLYAIAALIGIALGLLGAGGAIVAVPAFVYVGGIQPTQASGYALFVVAVATFLASIPHARGKNINWRAFWWFGVSTMLTIFTIRRWALPALPQNLVLGSLHVALGTFLMLAFGLVLLLAGAAMLRHQPSAHTQAPSHPSRLLAIGVLVGVVAGFLGVGGGFLMTPALVLFARLEMKGAVATSLALICANSAVGVAGDLSGGLQYEWPLVLTFTAVTTLGILLGLRLSLRIDAARLRALFGWVVVGVGVVVLLTELTRQYPVL
jgi:uncharacterized membrane protein YfcA